MKQQSSKHRTSSFIQWSISLEYHSKYYVWCHSPKLEISIIMLHSVEIWVSNSYQKIFSLEQLTFAQISPQAHTLIVNLRYHSNSHSASWKCHLIARSSYLCELIPRDHSRGKRIILYCQYYMLTIIWHPQIIHFRMIVPYLLVRLEWHG